MLRASAIALLLLTAPVHAQEFDLDAALVSLFNADGDTDLTSDDDTGTPNAEDVGSDDGEVIVPEDEAYDSPLDDPSIVGWDPENIPGDGEVFDAADVNDDGVVTDDEAYDYIDSIYAFTDSLSLEPSEPED